MPKIDRGQVVLLLADGFEELGVTILLTTLRQAGLAVTLVGLRSGRVNGVHGLTIIPNISLDTLLEQKPSILALALSSGVGYLGRLRVDPRVRMLLTQSVEQKAMLIGLKPYVADLTDLIATVDRQICWLMPEPYQQLEHFATIIAQQLQDIQKG